MSKHLVIMRGVPGSGKSTDAERLIKKFINIYKGAVACKCSADDYFVDDEGNYNFDRDKLGKAHGHSRWKAETAMQEGIPLIVIDNTNTMDREMNPYRKLAKRYGYKVRYRVVGDLSDKSLRLYASRNVHGVPEEAIRRMAGRLRESLNKKGNKNVR